MDVSPILSFASVNDVKDVPEYHPRRSSLPHPLAMNARTDIPGIVPSRLTYATRGVSQSPRSFVPLTPIIASPLCTPSISTSSVYKSDEKLGPGQITAAQGEPHIQLPYIPLNLGSEAVSRPSSEPPTPSSKQSPPSAPLPITVSQPFPSTRSFPHSQPAYNILPSAHRHYSYPPIIPLSPLLPCQDNNTLHQTPDINCKSLITPQRERSMSPLFHIPQDGHSDNEDEEHFLDFHREYSLDGTGQGESSTDRSSEGQGSNTAHKDDVRRYHALMELLMTEEGYLADLRVLVTIYLRRLPTLICRSSSFGSSSNGAIGTFSRNAPSSLVPPFSSLSRGSSFVSSSPLLATANPSLDIPASLAMTSSATKEKDRNSPRYIFTDTEVEVITRNAEELLQLHEQFFEELQIAITSLGFPMSLQNVTTEFEEELPSTRKIDAAIGIVSTKFATEASRFNSYQAFCSGHLEAFDLLRKIQQQRPAEWDAFEKQSSSLVFEMVSREFGSSQQSMEVEPPSSSRVLVGASVGQLTRSDDEKRRRHSLPIPEVSTHMPLIHTNVNTVLADAAKAKERHPHSRLAFSDYLIKPVQRICRYPLLLDQLKTRKPARAMYMREPESRTKHKEAHHVRQGSDTNVVVESASQAMRHVATSVDEAGRRQYISIQSSLIVSRIHLAWSSPAYSAHRAFHVLTPAFLSSLGACLLAGSLDVMHYCSTKPPSAAKTKYFGAFLYMGGYLVMVKVCKGKVYEPRHWFSLSDVDLTDLPDDDAKLPFSFLLSSKGHHFVMGAPCQGEKVVWISAIQQSLAARPSWSYEPTSSLQLGTKDSTVQPSQLLDPRPSLTTIQSTLDLDRDLQPSHIGGPLLPSSTERQRTVKLDFLNKAESSPMHPSAPSRHSSSASVKSIFSTLSSEASNTARRPSLAVRAHVDRGMEDVISEPCRTARYYATAEEASQRLKPSLSFSLSNSGLSMAGVMTDTSRNNLARSEASRTKSTETLPALLKKAPPKRKLSGKYRKKTLKISPISIALSSDGEDVNDNGLSPSQETMPDSPAALSFCSSVTTSNPGSVLASPTTDMISVFTSERQLSATTPNPRVFVHERACPPKRTRSMVDNVRGLFYPQPVSPTSAVSETSTQGPPIFVDSEMEMPDITAPALLKWWGIGSLRRRVRSSPDVPSEELPSSQTPSINSHILCSSCQNDPPDASQEFSGDDILTKLSSSHYQSSSATKRLSLFCAPNTRTANSIIMTETQPSRRSHRNIPLLHRLSPMNSGGL